MVEFGILNYSQFMWETRQCMHQPHRNITGWSCEITHPCKPLNQSNLTMVLKPVYTELIGSESKMAARRDDLGMSDTGAIFPGGEGKRHMSRFLTQSVPHHSIPVQEGRHALTQPHEFGNRGSGDVGLAASKAVARCGPNTAPHPTIWSLYGVSLIC